MEQERVDLYVSFLEDPDAWVREHFAHLSSDEIATKQKNLKDLTAKDGTLWSSAGIPKQRSRCKEVESLLINKLDKFIIDSILRLYRLIKSIY